MVTAGPSRILRSRTRRTPRTPRTLRTLRTLRTPRTPWTSWHLLFHRIEDAVHEFHRLFSAERFRQLERFVDDNVPRCGPVEELADREPQNDAVERRHPRQAPVLRRFGDDGIDLLEICRGEAD